jgi:hypothetical protein
VQRPLQQRAEGAGAEAQAADLAGAFQLVVEGAGRHAPDAALRSVEHQVHAGIGQRALDMGRLVAEVPFDDPEMVQEW